MDAEDRGEEKIAIWRHRVDKRDGDEVKDEMQRWRHRLREEIKAEGEERNYRRIKGEKSDGLKDLGDNCYHSV